MPAGPCIVGVAQRTWRDGAPEPLDMWEDVARSAADDAGLEGDLGELASLQVVYTQSWNYDDPPARLAERLGSSPAHQHYSGIGGTTPQVLVNNVAESLLDGETGLALVVGAEALATRRRLKKAGEKPQWSHRHPDPPSFPFEDPFHPAEMAHQVWEAWLTFAMFDIARRGHLGVNPDDYRRAAGELLAPMTKVAASNPHAWFPVERTVEELITPTAENRMVGYPYTKYMVSIMDVDMAAAVLLADAETADRLGIPDDKRVYLRGWSYATDPPYVAAHPDMWRSPAMQRASAAALEGAGVGIDDVAHIDLYSCFASSVNFACDALGIDPLSRPITVTGGLPFSGGAGSDYMTHSIAAMTEVLRADPGSFGLVSGVGMHMQKHAFAVYSTTPGDVRPSEPAPKPETVPVVDTHSGPATVAAYSVIHGREGGAASGVAVCDVDGGRCYARLEGAELLERAEDEELVGTTLDLESGDDKVNRARS